VHNPIANLVYCAHGGCSDTVIVDGKVLMRGGKVLTLNERDLYEEARDRAKSLIKRTGLEDVVASIWPMH
jgi:cytosine/adenosine deaminase-related metal-dependent hydrolase